MFITRVIRLQKCFVLLFVNFTFSIVDKQASSYVNHIHTHLSLNHSTSSDRLDIPSERVVVFDYIFQFENLCRKNTSSAKMMTQFILIDSVMLSNQYLNVTNNEILCAFPIDSNFICYM